MQTRLIHASCRLPLCCDLQVPFHWFVPLMTIEVATHIYGTYVFSRGLQRYWVALCYMTALLLALVVCAAHNVLGRKQFMGSQRREGARDAALAAA
jgi:heme exporter protein D